MKLLNIFNWVQSLVESFTFYGGAPSSGGGAMGGGRPFNPMQGGRFGNMGAYVSPMAQRPQGMPQNPMFSKNPNMRQGQSIPGMGLPAAQPQGMPPTNMGMPPMPQGMPPSQGQPMQGGQFGNMGVYVSPMAQPQSSPMQGQPTPDMLNNMKMKLQAQAQQGMTQNPNFLGTVVNQMQGQPTQGGLFGNMGAYVSPMAQRPQGSPQNTNQMQQAQSMNQMAGLMQNTPQY
jgi:hypothetical protein